MDQLSALIPTTLWRIFEQITRVPRPSKKEGKIQKYLQDWADAHNLKWQQDDAGNILISKDATPGYEKAPGVVLQSHMDMVCEKNADVKFDFGNDPIQAYVEEGWVKARGTTLGADDGIGIAATLAVLEADDIPHPALEALFTVDEETGLTGAFALSPELLKGKYLLNLDSEDEGEIFIGCAGGVDTVAVFDKKQIPAPAGCQWLRIEIKGLKGGHSGDDIEKHLGNANKLMARLLWEAQNQCGACVPELSGGNLRNAIPREAQAVIGVPAAKSGAFRKIFENFTARIQEEYGPVEPGVKITCNEVAAPADILEPGLGGRLVDALNGVMNGPLAMSTAMPGLVETSTNLASVKFEPEGRITVVSSQRSSFEGAKWAAARSVEAVFALAGAKVSHSEGYPGWAPDPSSHLLKVAETCYKGLFKEQPKIRAIHAGLECGLFLEKYPHLEMISFGPTLRGVHSPDERLDIASTEKFWRFLCAILKELK